jgi:hypothetical protein
MAWLLFLLFSSSASAGTSGQFSLSGVVPPTIRAVIEPFPDGFRLWNAGNDLVFFQTGPYSRTVVASAATASLKQGQSVTLRTDFVEQGNNNPVEIRILAP